MVVATALFIAVSRAQPPDTLWTRSYDSQFHSYDEANGCAVDGSGHLYVTGTSVSTGGAGGWDYLTVKYDAASGDTLWTRVYRAEGNGMDAGYSCAADDSGHVYVAGFSSINGLANYLTIKYDADGDTVWTRSYHSPDNVHDAAFGCAVDHAGNVYVTGRSVRDSVMGLLTIKYNGAGDTLWTSRYNGPGDDQDQGSACAVDNAGHLYVTGNSGSGADYNYLTIKYDAASGDTIWTRRYDDPAGPYDIGTACATDDLGHLYVTGGASNSTDYDMFTIKYDAASGDTLWTSRYNGPANAVDFGGSCAVSRDGRVYVTGTSSNGSNHDWLTLELDPATGDTLWTRRYNGPGDGTDYSNGCACDSAGNLYVTGYYTVNDTDYNFLTVKLNTAAGVAGRPSAIVGGPAGLQCRAWPNPSRGVISISYHIPRSQIVKLKVYNISGQLVKAFDLGRQGAGAHRVEWRGPGVAAGVYCYRLTAGEKQATGKLVVVK